MALTVNTMMGFLRDDLGVDTTRIDAATPLFSSGLVDSFALVSLLTLVEAEAGIRVRPLDVTLENMDTIERLIAYVRRRRDGDGG